MRESRRARLLSLAVVAAVPAACSLFTPATRVPLQSYLHRDWRFDRRMWIVANELEIFELKVVNIFDRRVQFHSRQWPEFAGELLTRLVEVVFVKMQIAKCVNKITRRHIDDLRHH